MNFVMTEKKNRDAIFEIFDFEKKSVLCDLIDETYIIGLLKRGANLYFREAEQKLDHSISIMMDLCGPKIRVSDSCHELEIKAAKSLENAIDKTLLKGFRTIDLISDSSHKVCGCKEMGKQIIEEIESSK